MLGYVMSKFTLNLNSICVKYEDIVILIWMIAFINNNQTFLNQMFETNIKITGISQILFQINVVMYVSTIYYLGNMNTDTHNAFQTSAAVCGLIVCHSTHYYMLLFKAKSFSSLPFTYSPFLSFILIHFFFLLFKRLKDIVISQRFG